MATISRSVVGDPEVSKIEIDTGKTVKRRALVGWNHQDDTPQGVRQGKIWCWTSEPPQKFQVFDQEHNRSIVAGKHKLSGVVNFTMIRMFHPYWTVNGGVPRDMNVAEKRRCRELYISLIRSSRISEGLPVDDGPENPIQPPQPVRPQKTSVRQQGMDMDMNGPPGVEEVMPVDTARPEEMNSRIDAMADANERIRPITDLEDGGLTGGIDKACSSGSIQG